MARGARIFRDVQETLSKCANVNRPNGEAKSSPSCGVGGRISNNGNTHISPASDAINLSKSPDLTENGKDDEKPQDYVNPLQKHDQIANGNVVKVGSHLPQISAPSHARWNGMAGRGMRRNGTPWAETRNESKFIHGAQVSEDKLPVNGAYPHQTSNASIPVKIAQGDSEGRRGSKTQASRKMRRVPVAACGGSEKVVRYDSRVKAFSSTSSPVAPGDASSGASRSANKNKATTSAGIGTGIGTATTSSGSINIRSTTSSSFPPRHNADSTEDTSSSKLLLAHLILLYILLECLGVLVLYMYITLYLCCISTNTVPPFTPLNISP